MQRIVLITMAGLLAAAVTATATAQTTTMATPNVAGRPATLQVNIDGLAAPINGRLPKALQVTAPAGTKVNLQAIGQRCSQISAKLNECPTGSMIGTGTLAVAVTTINPPKVRTVNIPLAVYLHSNRSILAIAKVFGWQVVPATLDATHGFVVSFDPLPAGPPFPGVSYSLQRITLQFGHSRVIRRRVRTRRGTRVRTQRLNLLRNPSSCTGTWSSSVVLTFHDESVAPLAVPTACARS